MEVTREFLEEHLARMRESKAQLVARVNQLDGAIAMGQLALNRLDEAEPKEEPSDASN